MFIIYHLFPTIENEFPSEQKSLEFGLYVHWCKPRT